MTLITLWIKNSSAKEDQRSKREDGLIQSLSERVDTCEKRHNARDLEVREIRAELESSGTRDVALYKENTTIRAKYDVLLEDHTELRYQYKATVLELAALKETLKQDRNITATLATQTANNV